jgi:uncharacterized integral membrane protein (TIGR00697 family)
LSGVDRRMGVLILLSAVFAVSLVSANFLSSKLFSFEVAGVEIAGPAGVVAYSATFLATDIASEVYGRGVASTIVKAGFAAQLAAVLFTMIALQAPAAPFSPVDEATYAAVVWAGSNIIIASLIAYVVSQLHDVWAFHFWRERTGGRWLWLRNNASTMVSQLIDTVLFITLAFYVLPLLRGGNPLPLEAVATIIYSQYLIKLAVALLDTPLVYLGVAAARAYIAGGIPSPLAARGGFLGRVRGAL